MFIKKEKSFQLSDFLDRGLEQNKLSESAYNKICRENALRILER